MKKILSLVMALSLAVGGAAMAENVRDINVMNDADTLRLCEVTVPDGYSVSDTENGSGMYDYFLTPEDPESNVEYVCVSGSDRTAVEKLDSLRNTVNDLGNDVRMTDPTETEVQGHKAYIVSYTDSYYDAAVDPDAKIGEAVDTQQPNRFEQVFNAYIDADGMHSVCLRVKCVSDSADAFVPDEDVAACTLSFADCLKF